MKKGLKGIVFLFAFISLFSIFLSSGVFASAYCDNTRNVALGNTDCSALYPSCTCTTTLSGPGCTPDGKVTGVVSMYAGGTIGSTNFCEGGTKLSQTCTYYRTCPSGQACSNGACITPVCNAEMLDSTYLGEGGATYESCQQILSTIQCPASYCSGGCVLDYDCYCQQDKDNPNRYVMVRKLSRTTEICGSCAFGAASLCTGLSAYWPFDSSSGSNSSRAVDVIGSYHGRVEGASFGVQGIRNEAYSFDGTNDYIFVGNISKFNTPPITLGAWVKYTATQDTGIVSKFDIQDQGVGPFEPAGDEGYALRVREGAGASRAGIKLGATSCDNNVPVTTLSSPKNDGAWHFVVGVFNGTSNKLYVDGILVNTSAGRNFNIFWADFLIGAMDHVPTFADGYTTDIAGFFNGVMDEVAVWNRALSDEEVRLLYNYYVPQGSVNPYWENMVGQKITQAQIGDTLRMVASGQGFNINAPINYSVFKDSSFWFIKWVTPLSPSLASNLWVPGEMSNNVYFTAKQDLIQNSSSLINIGALNNIKPVAVITNPIENNTGLNVSFTHASYDEDDLLEIAWDFGDGTNYKVGDYSLSLTPGLGNINHIYNNSGVYIVTLTVKEMIRNQSSSVMRKIYVFKEGINVIADVSSPSRNGRYDNFVLFNASQSFITNCSASMTGEDFVTFDLKCKYLQPPNRRDVVNGNIVIDWKIYSGSSKDLVLQKTGDWSNNYSNVVAFTNYFDTSNNHEAVLTLDYLHSGLTDKGNTTVKFSTGGVYCTKTISSSSWINATSGVVLAANSQDSCNKYTIPGYINSCCPIGLTCNASANSEAGKCISAPVDVYRVCSDYKDSLSCINDDQKLGNKSIGSNITCGIGPLYSIGTDICVDKTDCGCIWNSTRNVCQALTNYTQNCKLGGSKNRGLCIWGSSTLENNCNNSLANMILRSVANWKGGILNDTQTAIEEANCKNEVRTLSCPSVAKLPFMNETSLVIIIIVLLIVYILINRTNRKSKNKDTFKYKSNKKKKI